MAYHIQTTRTTESRLDQVDFSNLPFGKTFSDHMFVADYRDGEWQDLRIVPFGRFEIHPSSMSLHYGQAIFEGMKAFKSTEGQPLFFRPEQHAIRINRSAERMCMPTIPEDLFLQALHQLIELDQGWIPPQTGSALYIRPFMFANDEFLGVRPSERYRFMIFSGPVGPYYAKPVRLRAETEYIRAAIGGVGEAKAAGNYASAMLPTKLAKEAGFDQVLWLDAKEHKYVQEVGTMNIFFVIDGKVVTPETSGAILRGITRDSLLQILKHEGYEVEERAVSIDEVMAAGRNGTLQEVFGSGTAAVIAFVKELQYQDETVQVPHGEDAKVGPMLKHYIESLRNGTREDTFGWVVPVGEGVAVS